MPRASSAVRSRRKHTMTKPVTLSFSSASARLMPSRAPSSSPSSGSPSSCSSWSLTLEEGVAGYATEDVGLGVDKNLSVDETLRPGLGQVGSGQVVEVRLLPQHLGPCTQVRSAHSLPASRVRWHSNPDSRGQGRRRGWRNARAHDALLGARSDSTPSSPRFAPPTQTLAPAPACPTPNADGVSSACVRHCWGR
jgi:hypothetical protein